MSQPTRAMYKVFLDKDGCEQVAKGDRPYSWNLQVVGEFDRPREHSIEVASFEFEFPEREEAAVKAVEGLRARKNSIYAEAEAEARLFEERIQNLLALPAPGSEA